MGFLFELAYTLNEELWLLFMTRPKHTGRTQHGCILVHNMFLIHWAGENAPLEDIQNQNWIDLYSWGSQHSIK